MKQTYVTKNATKAPRIEKHGTLPFTWYVQSSDSKKSQLYYTVILSDDQLYCSCPDFKYRKIACKYAMAIINQQARWR